MLKKIEINNRNRSCARPKGRGRVINIQDRIILLNDLAKRKGIFRVRVHTKNTAIAAELSVFRIQCYPMLACFLTPIPGEMCIQDSAKSNAKIMIEKIKKRSTHRTVTPIKIPSSHRSSTLIPPAPTSPSPSPSPSINSNLLFRFKS